MTAPVVPLNALHNRIVKLYRTDPDEAWQAAYSYWEQQGLVEFELRNAAGQTVDAAKMMIDEENRQAAEWFAHVIFRIENKLPSDLCAKWTLVIWDCAIKRGVADAVRSILFLAREMKDEFRWTIQI